MNILRENSLDWGVDLSQSAGIRGRLAGLLGLSLFFVKPLMGFTPHKEEIQVTTANSNLRPDCNPSYAFGLYERLKREAEQNHPKK